MRTDYRDAQREVGSIYSCHFSKIARFWVLLEALGLTISNHICIMALILLLVSGCLGVEKLRYPHSSVPYRTTFTVVVNLFQSSTAPLLSNIVMCLEMLVYEHG